MSTNSAITLRDLTFEWPARPAQAPPRRRGLRRGGHADRDHRAAHPADPDHASRRTTNNLDRATRAALAEFVDQWPGTLVVPGRPHGILSTGLVGYLPQSLDGLDDGASAMDNVRAVAPGTPAGTIRNQLARLLLRGDSVDRPVHTLSGGERFRVSLASLLFAEPPAQLLILDEPTNNLDIASVERLAEALDPYRGALLVVSHDFAFLERIGVDTVIELDGDGRMHQRQDLDLQPR